MTDSFDPEITLLYCGRALAQGEYLPEGAKKHSGFKVRFVMMPCISKVEVGYLVSLIEKGADGVMLVACPQSKCQFMLGTTRAQNRVHFAQRLLAEAGIPEERLGFAEGFDLSAQELTELARGLAESIKDLGPNPMKAVAVIN